MSIPEIWNVSRHIPKLGISTRLHISQTCSQEFLATAVSIEQRPLRH